MLNIAVLSFIVIPLVAGIITIILPKGFSVARRVTALSFTAVNLFFAACFWRVNMVCDIPWAGFGMDLSFRLYQFSGFIVLAAAMFGFLIAMYSAVFMAGSKYERQYFFYYLLAVAFVNGAVLANNLIALLFFWEGLLVPIFGMILTGRENAFKTAVKMFVIVGISDLCMMGGIAITGWSAGTLTMSNINLPMNLFTGLAFVLIMIGAISKAGSMPFHSWIPDAAVDAPLPFMAILPASLEKLLGIYLLARISLDMFQFSAHTALSYLLMVTGVVTIICAVMMALVQKDYKRLLSYHAISQVGYMILGIGTAVPVGIVGGLFHMINHAIYKSCLFLTGGSVEKQAGTTDLEKLGGIAKSMPITFVCFIIAAASISGVPPFNGFFSKELVYDGALERGKIFYFLAVMGSFFTAASFLKLGHAAFLGKAKNGNRTVKEAPMAMLVPMMTLAAICVLFGLYNALPLKNFIQPILGEHRLEGHDFCGFPASAMLVAGTVIVLLAALINHLYGVKKTGAGIKAVDHIHYAPVMKNIYKSAEMDEADPYNAGMSIMDIFSRAMWYIDRFIDWVYDRFIVTLSDAVSSIIRKAHNGDYSMYIIWSLVGAAGIIIFVIRNLN